MEEKKSFKDIVQERTNMQRKILITFPVALADELDSYAKERCNDCYWLAFKMLLDFYKEHKDRDNNVKMLIERDEVNFKLLSERIEKNEDLVKDFVKEHEKRSKERKSFGRK